MSKFTRMPQFIKDAYLTHCFPAAQPFGQAPAIIAGGAIRDVLNGVRVKDIDIFVSAENRHLYEGSIEFWQKLGRGPSKLFDRHYNALPWVPGSKKQTTIPHSATVGGSSIHLNGLSGTILFGAPPLVMSSTNNPSSSYQDNRKIVEVYEMAATGRDSQYPLNLIFTECDPVEYVTKYFDFGLCKTWYDGTFVHMHGDYTTDVNNKTITMVLPEPHVIACYGDMQTGIEAMQGHADRLQYKYPTHKIIMPSV